MTLLSMRHYVILAHPRSGSEYLADLLQNNGLGLAMEHLNTDVNQWSGIDDLTSVIGAARRDSDAPVFGSKVMIHWFDDYQRLIGDPSISDADTLGRLFGRDHVLIHLYREDSLGAAISLTRAQSTGQWSLLADSHPVPSPRLDWPEVRDRIRANILWIDWCKERMDRLVATAGLPAVSVAYEDIAQQAAICLPRIIALIDPHRTGDVVVRTELRRQSDAQSAVWRWAWLREVGAAADPR
jgi:LPS sulfotransferase NodH